MTITNWCGQTASGLLFLKVLNRAFENVNKRVPKDEHELFSFVFTFSRINPNVIKRWINGGTPSIVNVEKVLDICVGCSVQERNQIIKGLREYKSGNDTSVPAPEVKIADFLKLKAIITDPFIRDGRQKYWVRTFMPDGKHFLHGDSIGVYSYADKLVHIPAYRERIVEKLGHSNFTVEVDHRLSVPEIL